MAISPTGGGKKLAWSLFIVVALPGPPTESNTLNWRREPHFFLGGEKEEIYCYNDSSTNKHRDGQKAKDPIQSTTQKVHSTCCHVAKLAKPQDAKSKPGIQEDWATTRRTRQTRIAREKTESQLLEKDWILWKWRRPGTALRDRKGMSQSQSLSLRLRGLIFPQLILYQSSKGLLDSNRYFIGFVRDIIAIPNLTLLNFVMLHRCRKRRSHGYVGFACNLS